MIVFVQPYGLSSPGGGPRILRALLQDAPAPILSVCAAPLPPPPTLVGTEVHLPARQYRGRIETTRFSGWLGLEGMAMLPRFERRLESLCTSHHATGLHGLSHELDFWPAYRVARKQKLPFYLSVHDDLDYSLQGRLEHGYGMAHIGEAWANSQERFVISDEMGREYCRRYGKRSYLIITDGLTTAPMMPQSRPKKSCRIYFMGLFHNSYGANLNALLQSLEQLQVLQPEVCFSVTCRSGAIASSVVKNTFPVTLLPLASEQEVAQDMEEADLLYLPLPFGRRYEAFSKYSLSTKMITYLGSGLPILYHGPSDAAAGVLLKRHKAALAVHSLDTKAIIDALQGLQSQRDMVVHAALALGRQQFMLQDQRNRFWHSICGVSNMPRTMTGAPIS